jgi:hypothetical protein
LHPKNKNEEEHKMEEVAYTSFFDYTGCINSPGRKQHSYLGYSKENRTGDPAIVPESRCGFCFDSCEFI